jgi:hypothetical protein
MSHFQAIKAWMSHFQVYNSLKTRMSHFQAIKAWMSFFQLYKDLDEV